MKVKRIVGVLLIFIIVESLFSSEVLAKRISNVLTGNFTVNEATPDIVYVSPSGNDTNSGRTIDKPLLSINTAISRVKDGGTVKLLSGSYSEHVVINKSINLIGNSSISGIGAGTNPPVISCSAAVSSAVEITAGGNNVRVEGLELNLNAAKYGMYIVSSGMSNISIVNNYIHKASIYGVFLEQGLNENRNIIISNNKIVDCLEGDLQLRNAVNSEVSNNYLESKSNLNVSYGSNINASNLIIKDNTLLKTSMGSLAQMTIQCSNNNVINNLNILCNNINSNFISGPSISIGGSGLTTASGININDNIINNLSTEVNSIISLKSTVQANAARNLWNGNKGTITNTNSFLTVFPYAIDSERNADGTFKNLKQPIQLTWEDGSTGEMNITAEQGITKNILIKTNLDSLAMANSYNNVDIIFDFKKGNYYATDVELSGTGITKSDPQYSIYKKHYNNFIPEDINLSITFSSSAETEAYTLNAYADIPD